MNKSSHSEFRSLCPDTIRYHMPSFFSSLLNEDHEFIPESVVEGTRKLKPSGAETDHTIYCKGVSSDWRFLETVGVTFWIPLAIILVFVAMRKEDEIVNVNGKGCYCTTNPLY